MHTARSLSQSVILTYVCFGALPSSSQVGAAPWRG